MKHRLVFVAWLIAVNTFAEPIGERPYEMVWANRTEPAAPTVRFDDLSGWKIEVSDGAQATLQVTPYYNKPTPDGLLQHFRAVADAVDLPLVVYNIAGRTGKNIENPVMLELAKHPGIRAVKEASGDLNQVMDLIAAKPADFAVLSGDDNLVYPIMTLGGTGVISVASNLVPDRMAAFVGALLKGDCASARRMHYELLPLFRAIFVETNPIPIKAALAMKGMIAENYRLPMCPLAPKSRERLTSVLKGLALV